jgi:hypothetical protein
MKKLETPLALPDGRQAAPGSRRYQAPTLTEKRALEEVTLFSFACTPGAPNCNVGHP